MIILDFENWNVPGVKNNKLAIGESANMVLFVIEGEVVEIIGVNNEVTEKLISASNFEECQLAMPISNKFCVEFDCSHGKERIIVDEKCIQYCFQTLK